MSTTSQAVTTEEVLEAADSSRPSGREEVCAALVEAAANLLVERGTSVPVREIASKAGVNHGLVHLYFGSKQQLMADAVAHITKRSAAQLDRSGYPPPDLATRDDGALARSLARIMVAGSGDDKPLPSEFPILHTWLDALRRDRPDLDDERLVADVVRAASLALGWSLFADFFEAALEMTPADRIRSEEAVNEAVAELGHLPGIVGM